MIYSPPENLTNEQPDGKQESWRILERLEHVIEKLKDARKEINEAVLAALEMKEAGDDIADQMIVSMVAQDNVRNKEIIIGQTQTKMMPEGLRKKFLAFPQNVVIAKDAPFKDQLREAEKPLYLARYE